LGNINVIKRNEHFQMIFEKGHSMYGKYLVVYFLQNDTSVCRFGFCVGKKIGIAVIRNRIKRLFREAVRQLPTYKIQGWDIVLVAKHSVLKANLTDISKELNSLCFKARIYNSQPEKEDSCFE
jgi:ribonuclease P protein component